MEYARKIIELTNEYIESMPKKERKNTDSFYQHGNCPFYVWNI